MTFWKDVSSRLREKFKWRENFTKKNTWQVYGIFMAWNFMRKNTWQYPDLFTNLHVIQVCQKIWIAQEPHCVNLITRTQIHATLKFPSSDDYPHAILASYVYDPIPKMLPHRPYPHYVNISVFIKLFSIAVILSYFLLFFDIIHKVHKHIINFV